MFQLRFKSDAGRYVCCGGIVSGGREESDDYLLPIHLLHILHFISNKWAQNVKKGAQCETGHNKGPVRALIWVVLTHSKLLVILNPFLHIERIKVWMEILDFFYMNIEEEKMTRYFQALYLVHYNCWINDQNLLPKAKLRWAGLVLHKRCNLTTNFRIAFSW